MISRILVLLFVLCVPLNISGVDTIVFAEQETFPFLAEVTGDQVNVRSGQSANFESLCQLNKDAEVIVVGKEFSWYKIQLPSSAKSFVSKEYVQYLGQNAGGITADRVNIRAGAGTHFTVLGQVTKGEQIFIKDILDKWYRIEPVTESYGWLSEDFVAFKSATLPESLADELSEEGQEEEVETIVEIKADDKGIFTVTGYVEPFESKEKNRIHYTIISGGKPICYIQGDNHLLGRFIHQRVEVRGTVNQGLQSEYAHPVIIVSKVKLML